MKRNHRLCGPRTATLTREFVIYGSASQLLSFACAGPWHPFSWSDWYIGWPVPVWYNEGGTITITTMRWWAVCVNVAAIAGVVAIAGVLRLPSAHKFRGSGGAGCESNGRG